ncbi:MAG: hypothetical protein NT170_02665 [Candidatus Moranbacteria bacterium]|nr:hypothetical protein [Candidatus Moranbacteria bacterium]
MSLENPKKQASESQEGTLSKLARKTKGLAKVLVLTTALSVGADNFSDSSEKNSPEDISAAVQLVKGRDKFYEDHLTDMLMNDPYAAISTSFAFIPKLKNPEKFYEIAAQKNPQAIILYAEDLKSLSNSDRILQKAAENLLNSEKSGELFKNYNRYKDYPSAEKILEMSAQRISDQDLSKALDYAEHLAGKKYAQEVLDRAIKNDPQLAIVHATRFSDYRNASGGQFAKQYENGKAITAALKNSGDPSVKAVNDLSEMKYPLETKIKMSLLLQNFLDKKTSFEEMAEIVKDDSQMLKALLDLSFQPNPFGKKAIQKEIKNACLKKIQEINGLHEEADSVRFKSIENMNRRELYTLIVQGEEEIFTSTFNGFFNRLTGQLKKENISGDQLLKEVGHNQFRTFIKMAAGYDRLNDFLKTMNPEEQAILLKQFVQNIERAPDMLAQAVGVADTFGSLKDPAILGIVQKEIISEYQRVQKEGNLKGETLYGLLAGLFEGKIVTDDNWLREIAQKYKLPSLEKVSASELFNLDGTNVQQYFFYNDADGKGSFESFINQYKNKSEWNIKQKGDYLMIRSISGKHKKKIEIYANFPEKESEGPVEIEKELKKRNIQSIVVVHRGHSYHAQKTIKRIPNIAKIVSLGSCGGYNNLDSVLKRAPGAHIISTKGTGTMLVNDPLLKMLSMEILNGHDIEWNKFWANSENKLGNNKDFKSYVPPHKNLGVLFIKAYNEITKEKKLNYKK